LPYAPRFDTKQKTIRSRKPEDTGSFLTSSIYKRVGIASAIMMASVFLSRLIGVFREMVIAYAGGTGAPVDAYQVAFVIPEILNHIAASGFLSVTFIPIFSRYLSEGREEEGWRIFSIILNGFGLLLVFCITVGGVFTPRLIPLIAPGLKDPDTIAAAVRMTRIILPAQFFFFAGGLMMAVQFAKERFALPALAPLIYNLGIIAGGLLLGPEIGMEGFSWGVLSGAFLGNFALQYWGAKRAGFRYLPAFNIGHPDFMRYLLLTLPLILGLTMTFSTEFFLKFFGSFFPRGNIAALNYALRVMLLLVGLFGQAVGVASFPFMARLAVEKRIDEMNRLLNHTLRFLSVMVPFSALIIVLRYEVVSILFQRGRFDAEAVALTAHVLIFLMAGAFAFAVQTVVVRGYYATQNTVFPAIFGTVAVVAGIPFYLIGMHALGIGGVALGISLSAIFQSALLYWLWNRKSRNEGSAGVYSIYARMIVFGIVLGFFLEWVRLRLFGSIGTQGPLAGIAVCGVMGVLFTALLLAAGRFLGIREIQEFFTRLIGKFRRKVFGS